jgi:hypothetical protein
VTSNGYHYNSIKILCLSDGKNAVSASFSILWDFIKKILPVRAQIHKFPGVYMVVAQTVGKNI